MANQNEWRARLIAFYLPQFHPIPENDAWWGRGFTEWTNVAKAKPLFHGHYQPHIPANLGFYDLRVPEVRDAQASLASRFGIEGFCYWHYWFNGKRLLERPFDEVLESGRPDFPFCLAWANETWSRRWLGEELSILQKQTYSVEDDVAHARWLTRAFADKRYIKVEGRPVFLIYRPRDLPNPNQSIRILRYECHAAGLPNPYLLGMNAHRDLDSRELGFDGNVDFEPQLGVLPGPLADGLKIYDYSAARRRMTARPLRYPAYRSIFVAWDNSPRRGEDGIVFINSTARSFEAGLEEAVSATAEKPYDDRLVFLNAWNEWAEGNHLEPDLKNGLAYLEAVLRVNTADRAPVTISAGQSQGSEVRSTQATP
jgi:lipopolysaccharide biosynthesis protein